MSNVDYQAIAKDAIDLFLEFLEYDGEQTLDDDAVDRARARVLCEFQDAANAEEEQR